MVDWIIHCSWIRHISHHTLSLSPFWGSNIKRFSWCLIFNFLFDYSKVVMGRMLLSHQLWVLYVHTGIFGWTKFIWIATLIIFLLAVFSIEESLISMLVALIRRNWDFFDFSNLTCTFDIIDCVLSARTAGRQSSDKILLDFGMFRVLVFTI